MSIFKCILPMWAKNATIHPLLWSGFRQAESATAVHSQKNYTLTQPFK